MCPCVAHKAAHSLELTALCMFVVPKKLKAQILALNQAWFYLQVLSCNNRRTIALHKWHPNVHHMFCHNLKLRVLITQMWMSLDFTVSQRSSPSLIQKSITFRQHVQKTFLCILYALFESALTSVWIWLNHRQIDSCRWSSFVLLCTYL